ncbi:type 1 glutamine amidotransferase [Eupransor demetentiae]|uniref:Glutamine amidotransferase domain (GuaA1) n=1 Tax=Eupransor demetentiae TaxID=3109584 RepID=A0ABM9N680_9LACO|nr:GMP synthase [Lactobacillaceae bacterium LMG 33000]
MRINILQHTPNEGPGAILDWADKHQHEVYIYHPYQFGKLPKAEETDLLVILGGPMSPNDDLPWIRQERALVKEIIEADKPVYGACYGAQMISKVLGYKIGKAPAKEVGWGPVDLQTNTIPGLPKQLNVLHWHEEMFEIPQDAEVLYSNEVLRNQGFVMNGRIVGLQCHLEPEKTNIREMVVNDGDYIEGSVLGQNAQDILDAEISPDNKAAIFKIFDYITK